MSDLNTFVVKSLATIEKSINLQSATLISAAVLGLGFYLGYANIVSVSAALCAGSGSLIIGNIIGRLLKRAEDKKAYNNRIMGRKLGVRTSDLHFNHISEDVFQDPNHAMLGWQIASDYTSRTVHAIQPQCYHCRNGLSMKLNDPTEKVQVRCDGCGAQTAVDDMTLARQAAEAKFRGMARLNPDEFFDW